MVTFGQTNGGLARPKIPYACQQGSVPHGRMVNIIRNEEWIVG